MPRTTTYSALHANLKQQLDAVCTDHEPLRVERKNGDAVIVIAEADYNGLAETAYLLRSPENARRLLNSLHGDRGADRAFASVDELRAELGVDG